MSQKRKSGLQQGLSEIIAKQTAPVESNQVSSASLLDKFREPKEVALDSLPESSSLLEIEQPKLGLPKTTSLLELDALGYPKTSLLKTSSLPQNEQPKQTRMNLMASLPEVDGYTRLWHQMTDYLYRNLTASEQSVHIQLFRLSWGRNEETCMIGLPGLARRTGIAKTTVQRAVEGLIEKGLIEKVGGVFGKGVEQGMEYRVVPPPALLKTSRLPKTSSLLVLSTNKEKNIYKEHTQTQDVGVRSRYTLSECQKYAESLTDKGIKNPAGLARSIHRSGESDDLIAAFLAPVAPSVRPDASLCPDCKGSGWYEPQGAGKGVAKCKHERLGMS